MLFRSLDAFTVPGRCILAMGCCYVCLKTPHGSSAITLLGAFNGISGVAMGLTVSPIFDRRCQAAHSFATGWFRGREGSRSGGGGEEVEGGQGRTGEEQLGGYLSPRRCWGSLRVCCSTPSVIRRFLSFPQRDSLAMSCFVCGERRPKRGCSTPHSLSEAEARSS